MAKLSNPALFSLEMGISPTIVDDAGFFDPIVNGDSRIFIDPLLLPKSQKQIIANQAYDSLRETFSLIIRLVAVSQKEGDRPWREAVKRLNLSECGVTCLGYGGATIHGSSRSEAIKQQIISTIKEIVDVGEKDPDLISMMGIFEEGIGPDTISDMTTNIILPHLCELTESFCLANGVSTKPYKEFYGRQLPVNPRDKKGRPVILVPKDILRDLPLASDFDDVYEVVKEIEEIREAFNGFVGNIAKATLGEKKDAMRRTAFSSAERFKLIMELMKNSADGYDFKSDILNVNVIGEMLSADVSQFTVPGFKVNPPSEEELKRIVRTIIEQFKHQVENNNLWELLWDQKHIKAKPERSAQLLFLSVAMSFCKANDIGISPEMNIGGGPVDFKFSHGFEKKVLVEIKKSMGTVVHGYSKQLEIYKEASETVNGFFLVIDLGGLGNKLAEVRKLRQSALDSGQSASEIFYVDAIPRPSASNA